MIRDEIANYIRTYLAQGYNIQDIRNTLLTAGYQIQDINDSVAVVYTPKKEKRIFNTKIVIALFVILLITFSLFVILKMAKKPEEKIAKPKPRAETTMPPITKEIKTNATQEIFKPEQKLCIPECNDNNPCTEDLCILGVCQYKSITPCCGNNICETNENFENCLLDCKMPPTFRESTEELMKKAAENAKQNPSKAKMTCQELPTTELTDKCLGTTAVLALDATTCELIFSIQDRDLCYTNVAIEKKDFSICQNIRDRWFKNSCLVFQKLTKTIQPAT